MLSRLKFDLSDTISTILDYIPNSIWESKTTTFCDFEMGGGQFIKAIIDKLKTYGHSNENIQSRLYGFSDNEFYLSYVKSGDGIIGTFDIYKEKKHSNMKFDVIVGNPPYQLQVGPNKTETIWDKFVIKSFNQLNIGGYIALIHPSGWRNVDGKFKDIQNIIKSKKLLYLNMNSTMVGKQTFGVNTDYDFYLVENLPNDNTPTTVEDYNNNLVEYDLFDKEFIPNSNLKLVYSLVANENEEKVDVIYSSSAYETRNSNTSPIKTDVFKYPCVYTVGSLNPNFWYSNTRGIHFGIPKVIWGNGLTDVIIDYNGDYGLTQFAYAIADDVENLENIHKALKSDKFIKEVMGYEKGVGHIYNRKIISTFRKDFWKEFI
jgi:hypothetical protein